MLSALGCILNAAIIRWWLSEHIYGEVLPRSQMQSPSVCTKPVSVHKAKKAKTPSWLCQAQSIMTAQAQSIIMMEEAIQQALQPKQLCCKVQTQQWTLLLAPQRTPLCAH